MEKLQFKNLIPHIIAVLLFIIVSSVYFFPQLEGYQLRQNDNEEHLGMSREIVNFRDKFHKEPLWTNSAFSGMPAYQISTEHTNFVNTIENFLIIRPFSRPIGYILLAMIAFYILMMCFDISPWISIIGSLAFGLSSIFMLYLEAGHNSKVQAIALLPAVIGSLLLTYRKNYKIGAVLLSFFICLELAANHLQMTYYSLFLIACIIITELFIYVKEKQLVKFIKISLIVLVAVILGILPSFSNLYPTWEYGKYSTRGKSELTITSSASGNQSTSADALEASYITQYSMGRGETWCVAIPDIKGGEQTYIGNKKDIISQVSPQFKEYVAQQSSYWGEQAGSGGAFYFGATIFVLFILGLIFIADPVKWAFLAASVLGVVLSWKYGNILEFFIDHFPWFNKFRDTKMMLILVQISFPFLGMLFVKEIMTRKINRKKLLYSLLAVNGILFLFYIMPNVFFDFVSTSESDSFNAQLAHYANNPDYQNQINGFITELQNARIAIFKKDALRSLFYALVVSGLVYFFVIDKLKKNYFLGLLGFFVLLDLWLVDKRYLNNDESGRTYKMWEKKQQYDNPYKVSAADNFILSNEVNSEPGLRSKIQQGVEEGLKNVKDRDQETRKEALTFRELNFATDYRVLTLQNPFSNGELSYFHKSLGGYNGAKLKKYQELIDFYISNELSTITSALRDSTVTMAKISAILQSKIPVLNMLNTKYIIYNPAAPPFVNSNADGNCWFVKEVKYANNADEEMQSLGKLDLKTQAVVNQKYKDYITPIQYDSTAVIKLQSCISNKLVYTSKSNTPQLAVFSEIYYPKGWDVFIDGKKSAYFSANYILRAMTVPAGEHTIEFRFEPASYAIGEKVSIASSVLLLILILGFIIYELTAGKKQSGVNI